MFSIIEENNEIDYISNTLKRTFPHGHDIEIFKSQKFLDKKEPSEYDQEHVTPFFINQKCIDFIHMKIKLICQDIELH